MGEAERLDIKDKAPLILGELLYDHNIVSQIKQYRNLFMRVSEKLATRNCLPFESSYCRGGRVP